jgi:2-dehydro-3-deoxygluconokinase
LARIVCCGEGMVELSGARGQGREQWQLGHGGDTLNTAIHLARAGHDVALLTALGTDPFSDRLRQAWASEGLDTSLVLTHPSRKPGLYAIVTDEAGERSFAYWRETSAARAMFALPASDEARARASEAQLLFFSLITLAILPPEGRESLLALARKVRANGGLVAFDGNYRPGLWSGPEQAPAARDEAIAVSQIGLPTLEDEQKLGGAEAAGVAAHWQKLGCDETIVKLGADGCLLPDGTLVAPDQVLAPVDTSGAGDAFNAGYLGARLLGEDIADAARAGHALAGWTIMRSGAIPPRDA